jgi:hypothetical protein
MSADDSQLLKQLSDSSYEVAVLRKHGASGVQTLAAVMDVVVRLLKVMPYEVLTEGVYVVAPLAGTVNPTEGDEFVYIGSVEELSGRMLSGLTVCIRGPRDIIVWPKPDVGILGLDSFIAYRYVHNVGEEVLIDEKTWPIRSDAPWPCSKSPPTFSELEEALLHYAEITRRPDHCPYICSAWRDDRRLAFLPKPERLLRKSLFFALRYSLRFAQVREEQNQDETKPVDIEVSWWDGRRAALIEVKWMGRSGPRNGPFTTVFSESDAVKGLRQLDDYLERREGVTPNVPVIGHIFVYDARRCGVKADSVTVSSANGGYYRMRDIKYPEEILAKPRIGRPIRCFLEPVISGS